MQFVVCSVWRIVRLERKHGTDNSSKQQVGEHLGHQSACFAHGACDNMISALKILANFQDKENFIEVVHDGIRRPQGLGLRQVARPASCGERSGGLCV